MSSSHSNYVDFDRRPNRRDDNNNISFTPSSPASSSLSSSSRRWRKRDHGSRDNRNNHDDDRSYDDDYFRSKRVESRVRRERESERVSERERVSDREREWDHRHYDADGSYADMDRPRHRDQQQQQQYNNNNKRSSSGRSSSYDSNRNDYGNEYNNDDRCDDNNIEQALNVEKTLFISNLDVAVNSRYELNDLFDRGLGRHVGIVRCLFDTYPARSDIQRAVVEFERSRDVRDVLTSLHQSRLCNNTICISPYRKPPKNHKKIVNMHNVDKNERIQDVVAFLSWKLQRQVYIDSWCFDPVNNGHVGHHHNNVNIELLTEKDAKDVTSLNGTKWRDNIITIRRLERQNRRQSKGREEGEEKQEHQSRISSNSSRSNTTVEVSKPILYVGNIVCNRKDPSIFRMTQAALKEFFREKMMSSFRSCKDVDFCSVHIHPDKSRRGRALARVEFKHSVLLKYALSLSDKTFRGQELVIQSWDMYTTRKDDSFDDGNDTSYYIESGTNIQQGHNQSIIYTSPVEDEITTMLSSNEASLFPGKPSQNTTGEGRPSTTDVDNDHPATNNTKNDSDASSMQYTHPNHVTAADDPTVDTTNNGIIERSFGGGSESVHDSTGNNNSNGVVDDYDDTCPNDKPNPTEGIYSDNYMAISDGDDEVQEQYVCKGEEPTTIEEVVTVTDESPARPPVASSPGNPPSEAPQIQPSTTATESSDISSSQRDNDDLEQKIARQAIELNGLRERARILKEGQLDLEIESLEAQKKKLQHDIDQSQQSFMQVSSALAILTTASCTEISELKKILREKKAATAETHNRLLKAEKFDPRQVKISE
jgi:hypothetical protein